MSLRLGRGPRTVLTLKLQAILIGKEDNLEKSLTSGARQVSDLPTVMSDELRVSDPVRRATSGAGAGPLPNLRINWR